MSIGTHPHRPAAIVFGLALALSGAACSKEAAPAAEGATVAASEAAATPATTTPDSAEGTQAAASTPTGSTPQAPAAAEDPVLTPEQIPAVVARIDGVEVTREDLMARAGEARAALAQRGLHPPQLTKSFLDGVINDIVGNRLLTADLTAQGKGAAEADVEAKIKALRDQFSSDEDFDKALAARGFDRAQLRREIVESLTVQGWIRDTVMPSVQISENAAQEYYDANPEKMLEPEKVHARHILVFVDGKATPEEKAAKRAVIDAARKRIAGGEDFATVAKEVSEDKGSAVKGGDLGWFYRGQMVPPFAAAAFSLEPNTLSDVVETPFGFHLIEVLEKKGETQHSFDEMRGQIEAVLKQRQLEEKVQARIKELSGKAQIEVLL